MSASSYAKRLLKQSLSNLTTSQRLTQQRRSQSLNNRQNQDAPQDETQRKLKSVITQVPRSNKANNTQRKPSLDSRLGEMKQTPVASHNYFSNYHQYRTPTSGGTNTTQKKVSENNDSSTTNGYNQEKRPHTANFRSNSVSDNKDNKDKQQKQQRKQQQQPQMAPFQKQYLIPPKKQEHFGKKTLVLDLDETLVHSQFKAIERPDIVLPIEIQQVVYDVYILKRPGLEQFLRRMAPLFEIVVFTASLSKYADPLLDIIDKHRYCTYRLFREHCTLHQRGSFVKDLRRLGRPMHQIMIVDNAPTSYLFQPENAFPCISWYDEVKDRELYEMIPVMEALATVDDVRPYLQAITANDRVLYSQALQLINRERRKQKERGVQLRNKQQQQRNKQQHHQKLKKETQDWNKERDLYSERVKKFNQIVEESNEQNDSVLAQSSQPQRPSSQEAAKSNFFVQSLEH